MNIKITGKDLKATEAIKMPIRMINMIRRI